MIWQRSVHFMRHVGERSSVVGGWMQEDRNEEAPLELLLCSVSGLGLQELRADSRIVVGAQ